MRLSLLGAAALAVAAPASAVEPSSKSPMAFFEGRTVGEGSTKIMMRKPYKTKSQGLGRIERDGALTLVQQVQEEGKPPKERRWRIRQVAPNRFEGTMNEAVGPVTVEKVGERFHFRFRMKGGLQIEQWLTPAADWHSAKGVLTVRKLGITVATGQSVYRRVAS